MDYEIAACELIRALRGKRSQPAFSRRLGYKSNVVYTWESGRGYPTAAGALAAARRSGIALEKAFAAFYRTEPRWLAKLDPATPEGVAAFLDDIRGSTSIVDVAAFSGKSRFAIARWLQGKTEPKLPDFLRLIECCSLRLVDFLEQLVDPRTMPSIREHWQMLETARRVAYDKPWTQAILRAIELESYLTVPHVRGWLAERVGVSCEIEDESLSLLERAGQIRWDGQHWIPTRVLALDTRKDPQAALRLRRWWGKVALDRAGAGSRGMVYNLFGVSRQDLARLRELQAAYFNELRTIVAQSEPVEHVCLAAVYLMDLADAPAQRGESE